MYQHQNPDSFTTLHLGYYKYFQGRPHILLILWSSTFFSVLSGPETVLTDGKCLNESWINSEKSIYIIRIWLPKLFYVFSSGKNCFIPGEPLKIKIYWNYSVDCLFWYIKISVTSVHDQSKEYTFFLSSFIVLVCHYNQSLSIWILPLRTYTLSINIICCWLITAVCPQQFGVVGKVRLIQSNKDLLSDYSV